MSVPDSRRIFSQFFNKIYVRNALFIHPLVDARDYFIALVLLGGSGEHIDSQLLVFVVLRVGFRLLAPFLELLLPAFGVFALFTLFFPVLLLVFASFVSSLAFLSGEILAERLSLVLGALWPLFRGRVLHRFFPFVNLGFQLFLTRSRANAPVWQKK